ncbi:MAG: glycosyltransferase [Candidatus Omnitrophica bacterium]|nr:glycosyltransferase [Candidatus Omnitrophota bacterium]
MPKKRVILMYISETSGHHSATIAIEKALKMLSPDIETLNINAFNYTNPISEKVVNRIYMGVIKAAPKIWDYLYDNQNVVKKLEKIKGAIHKLNSPKFEKLFEKFKPDLVVCSQAFPCGMVAEYKKAYNNNLPLVAVLTDFVPHSYWIYDTVNYYITPSEEVSDRLIRKGVAASKIKTFGIPFDPRFLDQVDKDRITKKLDLNPGFTTLLIMGGGQGLGPIKTIVRSLENVQDKIQEIIVCGTNKKLFNSLKRKIKKYKKPIRLFGYASNINELMSVSDIIVSKPGGITTSEALAKQLPLIIVKPIPGQEASNTRFLTEKNAAIKLDEPKKINCVIEDLLNKPERLRRLKESARNISKPNSSLDIARFLLGL